MLPMHNCMNLFFALYGTMWNNAVANFNCHLKDQWTYMTDVIP